MANKKAEGMSTEKIITIILVLVVIVTVLMFLFRSQISAYINNLPGYQSSEKDKVITPTAPEKVVSNCKQVGFRAAAEGGVWGLGSRQYLWVRNAQGSITKTKLYIKGDFTNDKIFLDKDWALDQQVGIITDSKISIDSGQTLTGVTYEQLKNLDGAQAQTKGGFIVVCK